MDLLLFTLQARKILEHDMAYDIMNIRRMVVRSKVHAYDDDITGDSMCKFYKDFIFSGAFSNKKDSFFGS